jgi:hypothetical protein
MLEQKIAQVNARGFLLNNLFQLEHKLWRCNLRSADSGTFSAFGQGETVEAALDAAVDSLTVAKKSPSTDDFLDLV